MTSTQIIVLVLLAAAFAAGWVARGPGRRPGGPVGGPLARGAAALDEAESACRDALGGDDSRLDAAAAELRSARHELADRMGTDSPLVEDLESARDSLTLCTTWVRDGETDAAAPLAQVVRDARVRYQRAARAIEQLQE